MSYIIVTERNPGFWRQHLFIYEFIRSAIFGSTLCIPAKGRGATFLYTVYGGDLRQVKQQVTYRKQGVLLVK